MSADAELLEKARAFVKFAKEEEAWTVSGEKNGVTVSSRVVEGNPLRVARGVVVIHAPISLVLENIVDPDLRPQWDRLIKETTLLKKENDDRGYYYLLSKPPGMFISSRDFVLDICVVRDPDTPDSISILANSPPREEADKLKEPPKGIVRGTATNSGYVIEKVEGKDDETKIYYIIQLDLAGSLPYSIVNMALSDEPQYMERFRNICEEKFNATKN